MNRSTIKATLQYALGFALLAWVILRNWRPASGEPGLADTFALPFHPLTFAIAALLTATSALVSFTRWFSLVRAQGLPFRYIDALRLGMVGYFFNTFLPGSIGGDIVKAAGIAREQQRRTVAVATVIIDRAIGLWGLLWLLALCGLAFYLAGNELLLDNRGLMTLVQSAWVAAILSAGVWFALGLLPERRAGRGAGRLRSLPKVGRVLAELWWAVWTYRKKPRAVALALALSVVCHTINVAAYHLASRAFVDPAEESQLPTLSEHYLVIPVGLTVQAFVPTPGGLGGGEFSFGALYQLLGRAKPLGVRASLIVRVVMWALGLVGYLVYLRMKKSGVVRLPSGT
ncbi:MAG: lysylphosphatidylglycerol synthase transmembrane domain-containing protein [Gemmataceae bacterium]